MTRKASPADTAQRVAERIKVPGPWEVFAERIRRYEIHLNGRTVELTRGPIAIEGFGIRRFHSADGRTRTGFQASTDLSAEGVRAVLEDAEMMAKHSDFPAKRVALPGGSGGATPSVEVVDPSLWERPAERLQEHVRTEQQFRPLALEKPADLKRRQPAALDQLARQQRGIAETLAQRTGQLVELWRAQQTASAQQVDQFAGGAEIGHGASLGRGR